jgi:acyl-CoA synthetase (AMP-forming)/AMP-acid ligase II
LSGVPRRRSDATFERLLRQAARSFPKVEMEPEPTKFELLDALSDHDAARWREAEAPYGGRVALIAVPTARSFAAIVGALRAGLAVALAPPEIEPAELDAAVVAARCAILAGPAYFADLEIGELLVEVATEQDRIALVATHGGRASGILPLDGARETATVYETRSAAADLRIVAGPNEAPARFHESELIDAASAIVSKARIRPGDTILSMLSCASAAGLAAGPLAALTAGARLILHAPFDSRRFVAALEDAAPVHLVVPEAFAETLQESSLLDIRRTASLIVSCIDGFAAPALTLAPAPAETVLIRLPLSGGIRVETATEESLAFDDG